MIEAGREMFRAAAAALIEQYGIPPSLPRFVRESAHVVDATRPLQSVKGHDGRPRGTGRLPVTVGEDFGVGGNTKPA